MIHALRTCSLCGEARSPSDFYAQGNGLQQRCKPCDKLYSRERLRRIRRQLRAVAWEAKSKPCADCGVQYSPWGMEFDHISGEKVDTISRLCNSQSVGIERSTSRLREEIAKCEVVCANCHAQRSYERRGH